MDKTFKIENLKKYFGPSKFWTDEQISQLAEITEYYKLEAGEVLSPNLKEPLTHIIILMDGSLGAYWKLEENVDISKVPQSFRGQDPDTLDNIARQIQVDNPYDWNLAFTLGNKPQDLIHLQDSTIGLEEILCNKTHSELIIYREDLEFRLQAVSNIQYLRIYREALGVSQVRLC